MRPGGNLKRLFDADASVPVTSLIDITFLLLVFFLLTMKFRDPEGRLAALLPPERGLARGGAPAVDEDLVLVLASADVPPGAVAASRVRFGRGRPSETLGTLAVGDDDAVVSDPADALVSLVPWLEGVRRRAPSVRVRLDADASVPHAVVVAVLDAAAAAGIPDVAFGGVRRGFAAEVLSGGTPK
ncbi:MAG: Biopolymer transport protein ExbD/TolR [Planctomycetota bacterium]